MKKGLVLLSFLLFSTTLFAADVNLSLEKLYEQQTCRGEENYQRLC